MARLKKSKLKDDDYRYLLMLLERGYGLIDALDLLKKDNDCFSNMYQQLENGTNIKELLVNSKLEKNIAFYLEYVSFKTALKVALKEKEDQRKLMEYISSKSLYSLIVMLAAFGIVTIFTLIVLPMIQNNYSINEASTISLKVIFILKTIIMIAIIIFVLFIFYVRKKHREEYVWLLLHKINKDNLIKEIVTYLFSKKLLLLVENGISLVDSNKILRFDSKESMLKLLAFHFDENLLEGKDFNSAINCEYFDNDFAQLCIYGCQKKDIINGLDNYLTIKTKKLEKRLNKLCISFQVASYCLVGIVLVLAYQTLLLPLESLEGLI